MAVLLAIRYVPQQHNGLLEELERSDVEHHDLAQPLVRNV
jgi:hypothetical protein